MMVGDAREESVACGVIENVQLVLFDKLSDSLASAGRAISAARRITSQHMFGVEVTTQQSVAVCSPEDWSECTYRAELLAVRRAAWCDVDRA